MTEYMYKPKANIEDRVSELEERIQALENSLLYPLQQVHQESAGLKPGVVEKKTPRGYRYWLNGRMIKAADAFQ